MPRKQKLAKMIEDMGYDDDVAQWVSDSIIKEDKVKKVESGELNLPDPQDARNHVDRLNAEKARKEREKVG